MSAALRRGEVVGPDNPRLDLLLTDGTGLPVAPAVLQYQILTAAEAQLYPTTPGERASVDLDSFDEEGDCLGSGRYCARWTVPIGQAAGSYKVRWYCKLSVGGTEQTIDVTFSIADVVLGASPTTFGNYTTVSAMRAEGISEDVVGDERMAVLIAEASRDIDRWCGQWFEARLCEFELDGSGTPTLELPVPLIRIEYVEEDGSALEDGDDFVAYNRHLSGVLVPDDRNFPRLERAWPSVRSSLWTEDERCVWSRGRKNVKVRGWFGYTDGPGPVGSTPLPIARACKLLVAKRAQTQMGDQEEYAAGFGRIKRERSRDQEVEYQSTTTSVVTGDTEIDQILEAYMVAPRVSVAGAGD